MSHELIAQLNDQLRNSLDYSEGFVVKGGVVAWTVGVGDLVNDEAEAIAFLEAIKTTPIDEEDDPYGERDFGVIMFKDVKVFWKIDYYQKPVDGDFEVHQCGANHPESAESTDRVLTIKLADEY